MICYIINKNIIAFSALGTAPQKGGTVILHGKIWKVTEVTTDLDSRADGSHVNVTLASHDKKDVKEKKSAYSAEFEALWRLYPKRAGGNPKGKAYSAYSARIKAGIGHEMIERGVKRYAEYLKATNAIGSQYVMQAATFFGPDEHYLNDWAVPVNNAKPEWAKLPYRDEDLPSFAQKHGFPAANPGDGYPEYRRRLASIIEKRLAHP